MLFSELCEKEIVSAPDGERLGYIDDVEFDAATGELLRFCIYARGELFGRMGKDGDVIIERGDVLTLGSDIILVQRYAKRAPLQRKGRFLL